MKQFHKKTILSLASAMLLSSGMLISTQASAAYQRCYQEGGVSSPSYVGLGYKNPFSHFQCVTKAIPLKAKAISHYYGAICSDENNQNPVEAIVKVYAKSGNYPSVELTKLTKKTERKRLKSGQLAHIVSGTFIAPEPANYSAGIAMTSIDSMTSIQDTSPKRAVILRAIITDNPSEIPNQEHLQSLCGYDWTKHQN